MPGTREGGRVAAAENKRLYGEDFYKRIGAIGGRNGNTGGFAANPELAAAAGKVGGSNRLGFRAKYCKRGHERVPENLYGASCKTCRVNRGYRKVDQAVL